MRKVDRFAWTSLVARAGAVGELPQGAVNTALRLAEVIIWKPKAGGPPELTWRNEIAAEVMGISRSAFYTNIKSLKASGFFTVVTTPRGYENLRPAIPANADDINARFETKVAQSSGRWAEAKRERAEYQREYRKNATSVSPESGTRKSRKRTMSVQNLDYVSPETNTHEPGYYDGDIYGNDSNERAQTTSGTPSVVAAAGASAERPSSNEGTYPVPIATPSNLGENPENPELPLLKLSSGVSPEIGLTQEVGAAV